MNTDLIIVNHMAIENNNKEVQKEAIKRMLANTRNEYIKNNIFRLMNQGKILKEEKEIIEEFYSVAINDYENKFANIVKPLIQHLGGLAFNGLFSLKNNNKHWYDEIMGKFIYPFTGITLKAGNNKTKEERLKTAISNATNNFDIQTISDIIKDFYIKEKFKESDYINNLEYLSSQVIDVLKNIPFLLSNDNIDEISYEIYNLISHVGFYEGEI